jgi:hypothetical protein
MLYYFLKDLQKCCRESSRGITTLKDTAKGLNLKLKKSRCDEILNTTVRVENSSPHYYLSKFRHTIMHCIVCFPARSREAGRYLRAYQK